MTTPPRPSYPPSRLKDGDPEDPYSECKLAPYGDLKFGPEGEFHPSANNFVVINDFAEVMGSLASDAVF